MWNLENLNLFVIWSSKFQIWSLFVICNLNMKTVEQVERIIRLGVEKVAVSSAAVSDSQIVARAAEVVGSQSIVVVMDVKKTGRDSKDSKYEVWTHNASKPTGLDPVEFAKQMEELGAGEVVINSIDHDGDMRGYDLELVHAIRNAISLPITVLGGAGSLKDIGELIRTFGIVGTAAGSLFVFKGIYRAVLINYPSRSDKDALITQCYKVD
jgi:cyclase